MPKLYDERSYAIHPSSMILILILCGITALFTALSLAYVYSRVDKGMQSIPVPWLFIVNTFILVSSSICIQLCRKYFDLKKEIQTIRWGYLTIATTILFLVMQGMAWYNLLVHQIVPGTTGGHGYLYAISILHFLHVSAGIPFLLHSLVPLTVAYHHGNASLLLIDSQFRRRLKLISWYWHFIDVVWIYLVVFFLVSRML